MRTAPVLTLIVIAVAACSSSKPAAPPKPEPDVAPAAQLPFSGTYRGPSQCMAQGAEAIDSMMDTEVTLVFTPTSIAAEYRGPMTISSSMTLAFGPAELTPETADFVDGLVAMPVFTEDGKSVLRRLAAVLRSPADRARIQPFVLGGADVVEGRGFCLDGMCHYWAKKRLEFPDPAGGKPVSIVAEGADAQALVGDRMLRVGYGLAPGAVYGCEARLDPVH